MIRPTYLLTAAALLLGAGATSTPYAPMDGRYGYSEQRIETDRFRVEFHGNSSTSRETVETFLLYRAAELTLENGFDYFLVVERDTDVNKTYSTLSARPAPFGPYPYAYSRFPYYAYGYPWSQDVTVHERRRFEAQAYIVLRKGEKPEDDVMAFNASEVLANLGPQILQSQQAAQ